MVVGGCQLVAQTAEDDMPTHGWPQGQLVSDDDSTAAAAAAAPPTAADMQQAAAADTQQATAAQQDSMQPHAAHGSTKRCQQCNELYPLRLFPRRPSLPDGRALLCFGCNSEVNAQRRPRRPRKTR